MEEQRDTRIKACPSKEKMDLVVQVTERLFIALLVILGTVLGLLVLRYFFMYNLPIILPCLLVGALGGFVGIQSRLKKLNVLDLELLAKSKAYIVLPPLVGGILAMLLCVMFLAGLVQGDLFPSFRFEAKGHTNGFYALFQRRPEAYEDYAKLLFWSFIAGFSERFVIDIINQFDKKKAAK
jgi:hypothetical protein